MAFTYPPINTVVELDKFIKNDPKFTNGHSPLSSVPDSVKYTKFLENAQLYSLFRMVGPRMRLNSLEGLQFPEIITNHRGIRVLEIHNTTINRLDNAVFPNLLELVISGNHITSLNGVTFPETLRYLTIKNEQIQSLEGVRFPSNLAELHISGSRITSLKGITFPSKLRILNLSSNQIASFDGMTFPPLLEHLDLENNPIDIQTIRLLVQTPSETVIRDIVRAYPQTAAYFEQQKESDKLTMGKLQNHVRSIATFLQPLIVERKSKEEAKLTEGTPRLFVVNTSNGTSTTYSIPFTTSQTIQSAIDYLEQNYLLSVMNSWVNIRLTKRSDNTPLNPLHTFADVKILNEDTLNAVERRSTAAVQNSRGGRIQNKTKRKRSRSRRFN